MCGEELGDPACEKYDVEVKTSQSKYLDQRMKLVSKYLFNCSKAWMPGREMWGEISSCSNCTDYQVIKILTK